MNSIKRERLNNLAKIVKREGLNSSHIREEVVEFIELLQPVAEVKARAYLYGKDYYNGVYFDDLMSIALYDLVQAALKYWDDENYEFYGTYTVVLSTRFAESARKAKAKKRSHEYNIFSLDRQLDTEHSETYLDRVADPKDYYSPDVFELLEEVSELLEQYRTEYGEDKAYIIEQSLRMYDDTVSRNKTICKRFGVDYADMKARRTLNKRIERCRKHFADYCREHRLI